MKIHRGFEERLVLAFPSNRRDDSRLRPATAGEAAYGGHHNTKVPMTRTLLAILVGTGVAVSAMAQGTLNFDISDAFKLTYIGSYRAYVSKFGQDQDGTPIPVAQLDNELRHHHIPLLDRTRSSAVQPADAPRTLADAYIAMATAAQPAVARIIAELAAPGGLPGAARWAAVACAGCAQCATPRLRTRARTPLRPMAATPRLARARRRRSSCPR